MEYSIAQLMGLFLIYSFLGWCVEVSFVAVTLGQVVNRGFLNGPVCPIYGVGMLVVLLVLEPVSQHLLLLFLGGMLLCSLVELAGGWILEKVFHTRWWDYSNQPFNLGGYICLGFSLMWGLAVTFAVRLIHPLIMGFLAWIPHTLGIVLGTVCYILLAADMVMTLITIIGMRKRLGELERLADALHSVGDAISGRLGNTALAADAKLDEFKEAGQVKMAEGREKVSAAIESGQQRLDEAKALGQQKLTEARENRQQRWNESRERWESAVEELLEQKMELEQRRKKLLTEYRNRPRFGVRRLGKAFPAIKKALQEHLEGMDRE